MSIVIITIPGEAKRAFSNSLYKTTGGKVSLVVIHKHPSNHNSILNRLRRLYRNVGPRYFLSEIFHAVLLRSSKRAKKVLEYFRERSGKISSSEEGYLPEVLETTSVNNDEVFARIKSISPDLLVIWGGAIIKPHIIGTAKRAINLHMGLCPYYRGAIANQQAVTRADIEKIGATIHYAEEKVDTGDILETIYADISKPPRELFRDLNDRAEERYLDIATRLFNGENLGKTPQDASRGKNFLLKHWTPKNRYRLAKQIIEWEDMGVLH